MAHPTFETQKSWRVAGATIKFRVIYLYYFVAHMEVVGRRFPRREIERSRKRRSAREKRAKE